MFFFTLAPIAFSVMFRAAKSLSILIYIRFSFYTDMKRVYFINNKSVSIIKVIE